MNMRRDRCLRELITTHPRRVRAYNKGPASQSIFRPLISIGLFLAVNTHADEKHIRPMALADCVRI
jgi:hypothetical protein